MSLPQLIGLQCVTCQSAIKSVVEGVFCDACGNPIHTRCVRSSPPQAGNQCSQCGGDPDSEIAKEVRRNVGAQSQVNASRAGPVSYPVSRFCPKCKSEKFTRERPERWVTFAWDRRCSDCGTRYSPPTPVWAAAVFLVAGLVALIFGGLGLMAGDFCTMWLGLVGFLAILHGIRSLIKPGQV